LFTKSLLNPLKKPTPPTPKTNTPTYCGDHQHVALNQIPNAATSKTIVQLKTTRAKSKTKPKQNNGSRHGL
jgi:hypothetical protein